jgi:excisionase family DNA binding protein
MYQELLTVSELAKLLKVSKSSIYHRVQTNSIHVIRIGSAIRINPTELGIVQNRDDPPKPQSPQPKPEPPKLHFNSDLLNHMIPEIEKAFLNPPAYGDISIRIIMHDSEAVRIETASSVTKLISPQPNQVPIYQNRQPRS